MRRERRVRAKFGQPQAEDRVTAEVSDFGMVPPRRTNSMSIQKAILRFDLNRHCALPEAAMFSRGHDKRE
jgi:hypothetical protein